MCSISIIGLRAGLAVKNHSRSGLDGLFSEGFSFKQSGDCRKCLQSSDSEVWRYPAYAEGLRSQRLFQRTAS